MLSRKDDVTITWREWIGDGKLNWLTVKTDKTRDADFRIVGIQPFDSTTSHDDKFLLNSVVKLGDLHCIPVASDLLANVKNGINFQIGIMDDGLTELCGKLVFARLVNMTNEIYDPPYNMFEIAWQASKIFARTGIKQAAQLLNDSQLFEDVYTFQVGAPGLSSDCVIEIEHESCP